MTYRQWRLNNIVSKQSKTKKSTIKKHKWELIWTIYVIILAVYLYYCYISPNDLAIQMGIFLLTISAMIIIMFHNTEHQRKLTISHIKTLKESTDKQITEFQKLTRDQIDTVRDSTEKQIVAIQNASKTQIEKLQESTQKQIETIKESTERQNEVFIEQFQGMSNQLEQIAVALTMKSEEEAKERKKQMELEEERTRKEEERLRMLKAEQEQRAQEISNQIERIKPRIFVQIIQKSYVLFWEHYWLNFVNLGGDGSDMKITSSIFNSGTNLGARLDRRFEAINREQQQSFDCGNIENFRAFDVVRVNLSIRDGENRKYVGYVDFSKADGEWQEISLTEAEG